MEETNINLQRYNLTGRVMIVDGMAKFNGNYSSVLLGTFNGHYVALKVIKATKGQQTSTVQRKLLREVVVWGSATHRNIHPFYGFATDRAFGDFGALISPWCSNGDAHQYLSQNGPSMLIDTRVNLWKGVVEGVTYLHGSNPPIVHGDLKPGNVLIDDAGQPKICDFGLARILVDLQGSGMTTTSEHTGTTRYLAPELVNSDESVPPTIPSDLYALGCLGLELIYLQMPFSHWPSSRQGHIKTLQDIKRGIPPATEPPRHAWPSQRFWPIISSLWSLDPLFRSSALSVAQAITRTEATFPPNVAQRIISFVDSDYTGPLYRTKEIWTTRTRCLRDLCLVSRAYHSWATPVLYRNLWFYGDVTAGALFALNYSLDSSVTSPLTFNRIVGGYGMYTKSIVVSDTFDPRRRGALSTLFQDLLQRMPRLHSVHIGYDYDIPPGDPLATLKIYYAYGHVFVIDPITTIHSFSYLQRLSIDAIYYEDGEPPFPGASSRLFLPHLRAIKIYTEIDEGASNISSGFFLEALSGWILPSLQRLEAKGYYEEPYQNALIGFLSVHGSPILHLTLDFFLGMSQDLCQRILTLCTNLRFMQVNSDLPGFRNLPFHPNLMRLYFDWYEYGVTTEVYERFKAFKSMAPTLFPELVEAKVKKLGSRWEAAFKTGDDFITVKETDGRRRRYDGKGLEMDMTTEDERSMSDDETG